MLSKGLMIFIFGSILFIITLIWILIDIKNKEKREEKLLSKIILENAQGFKNNIDETQMLSKTLDLSDETEILENNLIYDIDETLSLNDETEYLDDETEKLINN